MSVLSFVFFLTTNEHLIIRKITSFFICNYLNETKKEFNINMFNFEILFKY